MGPRHGVPGFTVRRRVSHRASQLPLIIVAETLSLCLPAFTKRNRPRARLAVGLCKLGC
jgi:hypothetical protein